MKQNSAFLLTVVLSLLGCASAQSASQSSGTVDREIASGSVGDRVSRRYAEIADLLSQVRVQQASGEDICSAEAYQGSILEALQKARSYASSQEDFLKRVTPASRQAVEGSLTFKSLLADRQWDTRPDFLTDNLPGTHWEDAGHGAYGHGAELNFRAGGKVTVRMSRWLDENADSPTWVSYEGSWKIAFHAKDKSKSNPHVVITYAAAKGKSKTITYAVEVVSGEGLEYRLTTTGRKNENNSKEGKTKFYDRVVDECDA
jgi:hypothetical protein